MITETDIVKTYRENHPESRIQGIFRYNKNTGHTKQRECVICGYKTFSWCSRYPRTKQSIEDERQHVNEHLKTVNFLVKSIILRISNLSLLVKELK